MALITCSECGKEVSDKATACVHCGCPIAESTSKKSENLNLHEVFGGIFSAADAVSTINAYQPNQYVQFLASRRFWSLMVIYVGLVVFLLIEDGFYMASVAAAGLAPFFVPLIVSKFLYPFHHLKKYFEQNGVDKAIRNSQGSRDIAMAAYNAMPSKKKANTSRALTSLLGLRLKSSWRHTRRSKCRSVPRSNREATCKQKDFIMTIDVEKLRNYLIDYCGTALFGGFPAAIIDLSDIERMSDYELCRKAESLGIDLRQFETK